MDRDLREPCLVEVRHCVRDSVCNNATTLLTAVRLTVLAMVRLVLLG